MKTGADTMPLRMGEELGYGAWNPIRLTLRRKYLIPNDEPEQERLVTGVISLFKWYCSTIID